MLKPALSKSWSNFERLARAKGMWLEGKGVEERMNLWVTHFSPASPVRVERRGFLSS